jgi:hypothetical protein
MTNVSPDLFSLQEVGFADDPDKLPKIVDNRQRAEIVLRHELRGFSDGAARRHRTITSDAIMTFSFSLETYVSSGSSEPFVARLRQPRARR